MNLSSREYYSSISGGSILINRSCSPNPDCSLSFDTNKRQVVLLSTGATQSPDDVTRINYNCKARIWPTYMIFVAIFFILVILPLFLACCFNYLKCCTRPLPVQDPSTSSKFNRIDSPKTVATQSQGVGQGGQEGEGQPNNEQFDKSAEMLSVNQNGNNYHTTEPVKEPDSPSPQLERKRQPIVIHLRKNQNLFTQGPTETKDSDFQRPDDSPSIPSPPLRTGLHYLTPSVRSSVAGSFRGGEHKHARPISHSEIYEDDYYDNDYVVHHHGPLQEIELGETHEGEQNNMDDDRSDNHVSRTVESYI